MRVIKTKRELKYRLIREIKRGRLLNVNREVPRGIGKSTLLFELSKEFNCIIIVQSCRIAQRMNIMFNTSKYIPIQDSLGLIKYRGSYALLEEGLSVENETLCRELFNVIGGYSYVIFR